MIALEIVAARGPSVELLPLGGPAIELEMQVVGLELSDSGMQGPTGLGAFAGEGLVRVGAEMRLAIESLPAAF